MPILFWLPTIFMGAFFELARITCERSLALSGGAMLPDDPKEAYVVLTMAREIIDVWWGGIERDRAQRHPIDLEEYGRKHGVLRHYEGLVEQPLGATARNLFVA